MTRTFYILLTVLMLMLVPPPAFLHAQAKTTLPDVPVEAGGIGSRLPNGWQVTPAGKTILLPGDLPLKMTLSPDGNYLIVNTGGWHDHDVNVIDLATDQILQSMDVEKDWAGLCYGAGGQDLYVASGQGYDKSLLNQAAQAGQSPNRLSALERSVLHLGWTGGWLTTKPDLYIPNLDGTERWTAGLAAGRDGSLYVIEMEDNQVFRLSGFPLTTQAIGRVGYRPYAAAISPDGQTIAISNWGEQSVSLLNAQTLKETGRIKVGSHPNDLVWSSDGRLFVANAGSNSISVIAPRSVRVSETISTALAPSELVGSTPDALALSPDSSTLYAANADNNDVAVVDITEAAQSKVRGFIPTGWYPSALAVSADGKKLYVGVGKGLHFRPSAPALAPNPRTTPDGQRKYDPIGRILSGAVSVVDVPDTDQLAAYTQQVRANVPAASPAAGNGGLPSSIKHILYIIREGRSYDQTLGDLTQGSGDTSLALYGRSVTPNTHALAENFVLMDNFYANGEVSEDGHYWCDSAYATDFTEKTWPSHDSGRDEPDADDRLRASPAGTLWDDCVRHGVSFFSYGERADYQPAPSGNYRYTGDRTLIGHSSPAWTLIGPERHDTDRVSVFRNDLTLAAKTGRWPSLIVMSLPESATEEALRGKFTPRARMAANDLALGQIVQAVSQSPFWRSTAIFVVDASAQGGPDHVDAHRTVGLVISPFAQRHAVDHTFYTTTSVVRTIELLLGLPPMTQYDARTTPLLSAFTAQPQLAPYAALPPGVKLDARNP